jgi:hypothetical protein
MHKEQDFMPNDTTKTMKQWESELNIVFNDYDGRKKLTRQEVSELQLGGGVVAVDIEERTKWLKENGYEVTRESLVDTSLRTVEKTDDEE